jgi:hypothetical protein
MRVQPPGGVDQHDVGLLAAGRGDRLERDRGRVGAELALDEADLGALRPHLELLDGRRAERIAGREHHAPVHLAGEMPGQLSERRGLAGAVDARHEDHGRQGPQVDRVLSGLGDPGEQLDQPIGQLLTARELVLGGLLLELGDDLGRRRGAHVGVDERLLQPLPGLLGEILEQSRLDLGLERLTGLAQTLAQTAESADAPLRRSILRGS